MTDQIHINLDKGWSGEVYNNWEFSRDVIEQWDVLAAGYGDRSIFLRYSWFENWWRAFGKVDSLFVAVMRNNGIIKAIFPCKIDILPKISSKDVCISSLTNPHTCYYDFIISPDARRESLSMFIKTVRRTMPAAQMFFGHLHLSSENSESFIKELKEVRVPSYEYSMPWAPWISTSQNEWPAFYQQLSGRLRGTLKKCRKKAENQGNLNFKIIRNEEQLDENLNELFEMEYNGWKGRNGTAIRCNPEIEGFYRRFAHWAAVHNCLILFKLELNDKPIASFLCLSSGNKVYGIKISYNESYSQIAPGNLLFFEIFQYLFTSTIESTFEFLGDCDPWKMEWTSKTGNIGSIKTYQRSLKGLSRYMVQCGWKKYLKQFQTVRDIKAWMDTRKKVQTVITPSSNHPTRSKSYVEKT